MKILILRGEEESPGWREHLTKAGIHSTFLQTLKTEPLADESIQKIAARLQTTPEAWLVLSSSRGVEAWKKWHPGKGQLPHKLAAVGQKTAEACKSRLAVQPRIQSDTLQDCLIAIAANDAGARVISLTSDKGVKTIQPDVPPGMYFERHAIYTTSFVEHDPLHVKKLASENFDFCLFTSPSTFGALKKRPELMRHIESGRWKIAAWGDTTADYIKEQGVPVALVPPRPELDTLIKALLNY